MTPLGASPPGDKARATVRVGVPPEAAFRLFTDHIDRWWRRGPKFRVFGRGTAVIRLEPGVGGRLIEAYDSNDGARTFVAGEVTAWQPPTRLAFTWRTSNFAADEATLVEVDFAPAAQGTATLVTVTHSGWSGIRPDHPVRHGKPPADFIAMRARWWGELLTALRVYALSLH